MSQSKTTEDVADSTNSCVHYLSTCLDELRVIWNDVGIPPEQQIARVKVVYDNLDELMKAMVEEEKTMKDSYTENVAKCREECKKLSAELECDYEEPDKDLTVLKKEKLLRTQVKQLLKERQEKLRHAMELRATEGELCARLGRTPEYIPSDIILNKQDMAEVNTRIIMLTAEKNKRDIKLAIAAKHIQDLWLVLGIKAKTEREEAIESGDLDSFQLSNENMDWLNNMHNNLNLQLEENKKIHVTLMNKLESLWTRMELSKEEQQLFMEGSVGYSDTTIVSIKHEVHRLEELKLQNIQKFVDATRVQIEVYWGLLFYSEGDKKLFTQFYNEHVGENMLQEHETKLEGLITEYTSNELLYKNIEKRNVMWRKWEEFECRENDPNRFNNRGGGLLKEERQRKTLEKEIPKLEEVILKDITKWEEENEKIFTVFGHTFPDYSNSQKEELQARKDMQKENKQRQKEEQVQKDLQFGSTPAKTPKRRIAGTTILTPASKKSKLAATPGNTTPRRTPRARQFVHSSLMTRSPRTPTSSKDKVFPRVQVKLATPNSKRPDTPIKRAPFEVAPMVEEHHSGNSADSGCISSLDLENNVLVGDYEEFEKEVNQPSRDLMRSSSIHDVAVMKKDPRLSLLGTISEDTDNQF